ncbi:MAG: glycoside hydrolase family 3 C-terminal domain-containing protein [Bacilli bacterium]
MNPKLFRGLTIISGLFLAGSVTAGSMMEKYSSQLDQVLGTVSSETRYEKLDDANQSDPWNFKGKFKSTKEAVEGYKELSIRESQETVALLKNENNALPLKKDSKITMMGLRSYAPVYGNSGGSIPDKNTIDNGNKIFEAFAQRGFQINPSMFKAYENYFKDKTWGGKGYGATPAEYSDVTVTDSVAELSKSELSALNPSYNSEYSTYGDAAIVVVGRPGGESKEYVPGLNPETTTGNIMGLSDKEREIIKEAKDNFSKVIVLVNSTTTMEIDELKDDPQISSILWIGYPGSYGFYGVADVLNGTVNPSAYLGDVYAVNNLANPAMQSFGKTAWSNADEFSADENVNSYLVEAEGIYSGYRYYETRYNDIVNKVDGASTAKAGTYTKADNTISTADGTWKYSDEVTYPFGYGLSYTTFEERLDEVKIAGDKKTATVTVTVKNTGSVAGKKAVQLYAQSPYTEYDQTNNVEKSSIQLMDFEKTDALKPNESQTITMNVDMSNIASYDYTKAKTFVLDQGDYYFALGSNAHDALNNVLANQGKRVADGMDYEGKADSVYRWNWSDFDSNTFRYSDTGKEITNQLTEGDYAMDLNNFMEDKVTYFTRKDWNGTFPSDYLGLTATGRLKELLKNDIYTLKTGEDTSAVKFGDTTSTLTLADLKGAAFDDERFDELASKVSIDEFLSFASNAFHNIAGISSVGYAGNKADDGPGGSDTHYLNESTYQGEKFTDYSEALVNGSADSYLGTRTAPSPTNLAYSFNKELAYENGNIIIGETSLLLNLPIIIGPGGNLHRHGYNGRGGEYYSEDPILSGYVGSAVVQGAQEKGCLVNIKHAAFNDQEANRSGIAVFTNEQKAREMELRNLNAMFTAKGKPASFYKDETKNNTYKLGALGVMTSYNRIGAVASSANSALQKNILREEWGFNGYSVTDFTGVSLKAAPKESILAGTVAFCGFGKPSLSYWNTESLSGDYEMAKAIHTDIKYILYSLANSNALNGVNSSYKAYTVQLETSWRIGYKSAIAVTSVMTAGLLAATVVFTVLRKKED